MKKKNLFNRLGRLSLLIFCLFPMRALAVDLIIGAGDSLINNTLLYVDGNIINNGTIRNLPGGTIQLTGNLINNGVFTSVGIEEFVGTTNQTITGSFTGTNYLGFVKKSNVGNIILDNSFDCDSILFTTNGKFDCSNGPTISIKTGSITAIQGYSNVRWIDLGNNSGALARMFSIVNSAYVFPVGSTWGGAGYMRFDITPSSFGSSGPKFVTGMLNIQTPGGTISYHKFFPTGFSGTLPGICTPGPNGRNVDFDCLADNYWTFSGPNDYVYTVIGYIPTCVSAGAGSRGIVRTPTGTPFWTANVETLSGVLTDCFCLYLDWSLSTTAFPGGVFKGLSGDFALATGTTPLLPIELANIQAKPVENKFIQVTWQTASEQNTASYEIQRSTDAIHWENTGIVPAHGTTSKPSDYLWNDYNVIPNITYYYQVKATDYDGSFKLLPIVSAQLFALPQVEMIFPNPSRNTRNIVINLPDEATVSLRCTDILGNQMFYESFMGTRGLQTIPLHYKLSSGNYFLQIQIGDYTTVRKFTEQ